MLLAGGNDRTPGNSVLPQLGNLCTNYATPRYQSECNTQVPTFILYPINWTIKPHKNYSNAETKNTVTESHSYPYKCMRMFGKGNMPGDGLLIRD